MCRNCYRDFNGIWNQCQFHELAQEFNAEIPDWEILLAEHDARESGNLITGADIEIGESDYIQQIADWDTFYSILTERY